jgi:preprotein translocase subunit SecE
MNRSLRRHPVEAKPAKSPLTRAPGRATLQRAQSSARRSRLPGAAWLMEIIAELKKVTWPTWETTAYLSFVVIVISVLMGLILGGVDAAFSWFIERLLF